MNILGFRKMRSTVTEMRVTNTHYSTKKLFIYNISVIFSSSKHTLAHALTMFSVTVLRASAHIKFGINKSITAVFKRGTSFSINTVFILHLARKLKVFTRKIKVCKVTLQIQTVGTNDFHF